MSKTGTFISVAEDQEGKNPRIITDDFPLRVNAGFGDLTTDAWGRQKVSADYSLFHSLFTFDIPATLWLYYENSVEVPVSTTVTSINGLANVSSGGNVSTLSARRHPRYQPNRGQLWSASMIFPNPDADGIRDFGLFDDGNGVFFRLKQVDGVGRLHACLLRGGSTVRDELITIPFDIDLSKGNIFDIQMQWRGVGNIKFFAGNPETGASELIHTLNLLNTLTTLSTEDAAMSCSFRSTNVTEDVTLQCGCVDLTSEGGGINREQYGSAFAENVAVNGTNSPVLVIRQPLLISGKQNTRDIRFARATVKCSKKGTFKVWTGRDPAGIIGATFQEINNGSFVETDSPDVVAGAVRATSINTSLLRYITSISVEATVRTEVVNPSRETIEFFLIHGDYVIITGTFSAATAEAVIEWGEEI